MRSQTVARSAPVAAARSCAVRGKTSSVEYVSDMRSPKFDSTSYGVARPP